MLLPLMLGATAIAGAALVAKRREATPAAPAPSASDQIKAKLEPAMSEPLKDAVTNAVLQSTDAKALVTLATKLEPVHPVAAAVVATRAKQIATAPATPEPTQGEPGDRIYTVVAGDNPTRIGQRLAGRADPGMVRELAASNPTIAERIVAGDLRVGERLKIPSSWIGTPVPSDTAIITTATYGVVAGDSPAKIAKKLTGSSAAARVAELAAANASKATRIKAGQLTPYNAKTGAGDLLVIPESWRK